MFLIFGAVFMLNEIKMYWFNNSSLEKKSYKDIIVDVMDHYNKNYGNSGRGG